VQLYPYLTFNGQCEAAFALYEEALHGKTVVTSPVSMASVRFLLDPN